MIWFDSDLSHEFPLISTPLVLVHTRLHPTYEVPLDGSFEFTMPIYKLQPDQNMKSEADNDYNHRVIINNY